MLTHPTFGVFNLPISNAPTPAAALIGGPDLAGICVANALGLPQLSREFCFVALLGRFLPGRLASVPTRAGWLMLHPQGTNQPAPFRRVGMSELATHPIDFYAPEAVQMVMDKYVDDLDRMRSGMDYVALDLRKPEDRDRVRMMRIHLSKREIADTYGIRIDVIEMIMRSRKEVF